jgi:hypothetical protein
MLLLRQATNVSRAKYQHMKQTIPSEIRWDLGIPG